MIDRISEISMADLYLFKNFVVCEYNTIFEFVFINMNLSINTPQKIQNVSYTLNYIFNDQSIFNKVSKGAKIRNQYNQVPHLTKDTNGKVTNSQLDTTNESQEVSPFPAGDHKAHINRVSQRHSKYKTDKT